MARILMVGLLLGLVGCLPEAARLAMVPSDVSEAQRFAARPIQRAPATELVAKRVLVVGQKLITTNRSIGIRPLFTTLGVPQEELFHRPPDEIFISEGLVAKCKTDDQLAAILALQLGRLVAEREIAGAGTNVGTNVGGTLQRVAGEEIPIGNDARGSMTSADGLREMELARLEKAAKGPRVPPEPESLARAYLRRAGFDENEVRTAETLARLADANGKLARQFLHQPPSR